MTAPNMATITASLERSLQNCSLNRDGTGASGGVAPSATSDDPVNLTTVDTAFELNSHVALPYQWKQCLDLKTGESDHIDWQNGTKEKENPRKTSGAYGGLDFCSEEDSSYSYGYEYDNEGYSLTSTPSSRDEYHCCYESDHILVVAGCKRCLMYFMLPKQVQECPKCDGLILHFDRSIEKRLP